MKKEKRKKKKKNKGYFGAHVTNAIHGRVLVHGHIKLHYTVYTILWVNLNTIVFNVFNDYLSVIVIII